MKYSEEQLRRKAHLEKYGLANYDRSHYPKEQLEKAGYKNETNNNKHEWKH